MILPPSLLPLLVTMSSEIYFSLLIACFQIFCMEWKEIKYIFILRMYKDFFCACAWLYIQVRNFQPGKIARFKMLGKTPSEKMVPWFWCLQPPILLSLSRS